MEEKSEIQGSKWDFVVCTIISKNYLPFARVLTNSFIEHHPGGKLFVMLVDRIDGYFEPEKEKFELVLIDNLSIKDVESFCFKYNILELNTAVKPFFLEYLFERYNLKKLIYLDPDILITDRLDCISKLLDEYSIILIPHLLEPIEDEYIPSEIEILKAGTYNLGFIALSNTKPTRAFLSWWKKRAYYGFWMDPDRGYHVDQKWVDLVPGLFDSVFILREPGYNVAFWNIHGRVVTEKGGSFYTNNKPLYFFHFSGIDPSDINKVSKFQNRFTLNELKNVESLFKIYLKLLNENGYEKAKNYPYAFDFFDNGTRIPYIIARKIFRNLGKEVSQFGNPFSTQNTNSFFNWLNESIDPILDKSAIKRIWYEIYKIRPDVQFVYPDIFGKDRNEFIGWIRANREFYHLDGIFLETHVPKTSIKGIENRVKVNYYSRIHMPLKRSLGRIILRMFGKNERILKKIKKLDKKTEDILFSDLIQR